MDVAQLVEGWAGPMAADLGLELVAVEFVKEGADWFLRLYIDKPGGVTHDDCEALSNRIGAKLDAADPIPQSYHLEVSSPGLERPLRKDADFVRFAGLKVRVHTYAAWQGKKQWDGVLLGLNDTGGGQQIELELAPGRERVALPRAQVSRVHLLYEPETKGKKLNTGRNLS